MAVYTEVSDEELTTFIESYDLGQLLSFKGIAEGVENTNYFIHTDIGTYILTLYEKRVNEEDLPFFLDLMTFMAENGINCPLPVEDKKGKALRTLSGRPAALITFLEGIWIRRPKTEHCEALGEVLAKFHIAGQKFQGRLTNSLTLQDWRPLYEKFEHQADDVKHGLQKLISNELDFLEKNWPQDLPKGIIHGDLFPDNVFFIGKEVSGLIDFYFSCHDILCYDLAICLNAWCFEQDISFNITKARALLKSYNKIRTIEEHELKALPIIARGASLRFLLTRVYDWLNTCENALVSRKDPEEYIRKLRFHQSVTNIQDYGFDIS